MPYSTSQVLTHLSAGRGLLVLDGTGGEAGETVLRYAAQPKVTTLDGDPVEVTWDAARKDLRLNYTHGGTRTLRITGDGRELTVLITDRDGVATTWHLDAGASDVLVTGPELARTAHLTGTRLDLTGDTRRAGPLRVFAPAGADVLTWNGKQLTVAHDGSSTRRWPASARSPAATPRTRSPTFSHATPVSGAMTSGAARSDYCLNGCSRGS